MIWTPHQYQEDSVSFCVKQATAGLFLSPGLGKTSIIYETFQRLRAAGAARRMLVLAPLRPALSTWPKERTKWDQFQGLKVSVLHGKDKDKALRDDADVHIVNYDGLPWLRRSVGDRPLWDVLVADEVTKLKNPQTLRFKTLRPWLEHFRRRYVLTGSPAPNGLLDLFGQVYVLDLGASLGRFISHYRMLYFNQTGYGGYKWVPRKGADAAIAKRIAPLIYRLDAKDVLELPPLIDNDVEVTLPEKARHTYRQMESLMLAQVEQKMVLAANAAAVTGKCRQIANGGIYHEGGEEWSQVHDAKTEAVRDLVEELNGKPALIAYEFKHDLERLRKVWPDAPYIGGGVPAKRFREIEEEWNAGMHTVLLAQPQSVAHGLNLQNTEAAVVWYGLPWDLEVYEQFVRRVWRQGQKGTVVVHHVVAKDTVDEVVLKAIRKKDRTQQTLLDELKEYSERRKRGGPETGGAEVDGAAQASGGGAGGDDAAESDTGGGTGEEDGPGSALGA